MPLPRGFRSTIAHDRNRLTENEYVPFINKEHEMESKYLTKAKLIAVNNRARKAGGNYIDPAFVEVLPDRFRFPVCPALPFPLKMGWVRCWVTVGADDPVVRENIHHLFVDVREEVFAKLPSVSELAEVEG
jgi:hypothetical protein